MPDTDAFMVGLAKLAEINTHLYLLTGTKDKRRIINLDAVCDDANARSNKSDHTKYVFMNAILGFHVFTGCNRTREFSGCKKLKTL